MTNAAALFDSNYRYGYAFDDIGNRNTAAERGTNFMYSANAMNQYTNILCVSAFHFRVQSGRYQALIRSGLFVDCMLTIFLVCVAVASLGISNVFGMIFGLAMTHRPDRANEISGLMVMAISGGAVLPPVMGYVQGLMGPAGLVAVLVVCLLYLLGLSFFAVLMDNE